MREKLVNDIMMLLYSYGVRDDNLKNSLYMVMSKYEISERETALAVRSEDKNRMYMERFIVAKTVKGCTERTIEEYRRVIWKVLEDIGKTADEITSDDVRIYLAVRQKRDNITKSYADTELRYLRTFFGFLSNEGIITLDPVKKIEKIKCDKKAKKAFEEIEIEKIRDACKTNRERCIIEMFLSTGCRVSELVGMKISDLESDRIVVHGKGNKDRIVYLNAKAVVALQKYLDEREDKNPYIFPGGFFSHTKKGFMWYTDADCVTADTHADSGTIESMVRRIGKDAGVKNTHPHRFRRTCATMALRRGMSLMIVSKMLGHENIATTQIYLDLDEREVEQEHKKYVI